MASYKINLGTFCAPAAMLLLGLCGAPAEELFKIENDFIAVSVSETRGIVLFDKIGKISVEQTAPVCPIKNLAQKDGTITFDIEAPEFPAKVALRLASEKSFELRISADGEMKKPIPFPSPWKMQKSDIGIYPLGNGYAFPVDMHACPLPKKVFACASANWSMAMSGFERGGLFVASALEKGHDAQFLNEKIDGLTHTSIQWLPELGKFGYERAVRYFVGHSLAETMLQYRQWRKSQGYVRTLEEKAEKLPHINKLRGAADIWLWDENDANRLYGRPANPNAPKRDAKKLGDELVALGMKNILWNYIGDETREDCLYLKSLGFLVGRYEVYRDVLPKTLVDKVIPYRVERSVNTKYWPDIVRIDENGNRAKAWKVHGLDGKMYSQESVCEICALELTKINVPANIAKVPYNARFIDVQAATPLNECHSPKHPASRRVSAQAIAEQERYLASLGLVNGVECGQEILAAYYDYAEGLLSPHQFRIPDAGRRMTDSLSPDQLPEAMEKFMLGAEYRIPLWELVYHDCVVNYWYWGVSNCICPDLMYKFDLFDALYAYPPIYSLSVANWEKLKGKIAQSYARATRTARAAGFAQMTDFKYLTADKKVQQTKFANGITVTANFGDCVYTASDGGKIAPWDYAVDGE